MFTAMPGLMSVFLLIVLVMTLAADQFYADTTDPRAASEALHRSLLARAEPSEGDAGDYVPRPEHNKSAVKKRDFRYILRHRVGAPLPFRFDTWLKILRLYPQPSNN
ncbi:hypothetical protein LSAT2_021406 [Lamellibrachia satsuma]|nr:hypothetical protein LSAT2_021406 [Lamellibrachia satsuma]